MEEDRITPPIGRIRCRIEKVEEPWIRATILVPDEFLGPVLALCQERRGEQIELTYAGSARDGGVSSAAQRGGIRFLRSARKS